MNEKITDLTLMRKLMAEKVSKSKKSQIRWIIERYGEEKHGEFMINTGTFKFLSSSISLQTPWIFGKNPGLAKTHGRN